MPWVKVQQVVAERWCIPRPDVNGYPYVEILTELKLMEIEAECSKPNRPSSPRRHS